MDIPWDAVRRFRRAEYDELVRLGLFEGEKVELLYGVIVRMTPQGSEHFWAANRLAQLLIQAVGDRAFVAVQSGFAASDDSEPEPDVAVYPPGDYWAALPDSPLLVVEVAKSSLRHDRRVKATLYAEVGVPEYWLVDLVNRLVTIHRRPVDGAWTHLETVAHDGVASPSTLPDVALRVADFVR